MPSPFSTCSLFWINCRAKGQVLAGSEQLAGVEILLPGIKPRLKSGTQTMNISDIPDTSWKLPSPPSEGNTFHFTSLVRLSPPCWNWGAPDGPILGNEWEQLLQKQPGFELLSFTRVGHTNSLVYLNIQTGAISSSQESAQGREDCTGHGGLAGGREELALFLGLCSSPLHVVATCNVIYPSAPGLRAEGAWRGAGKVKDLAQKTSAAGRQAAKSRPQRTPTISR